MIGDDLNVDALLTVHNLVADVDHMETCLIANLQVVFDVPQYLECCKSGGYLGVEELDTKPDMDVDHYSLYMLPGQVLMLHNTTSKSIGATRCSVKKVDGWIIISEDRRVTLRILLKCRWKEGSRVLVGFKAEESHATLTAP